MLPALVTQSRFLFGLNAHTMHSPSYAMPPQGSPSPSSLSFSSRRRGPSAANGAPPTTLAGRLAFGALLVALVWAPLPLASNRPWSLALLTLWVWGALGLAAWDLASAWRLGSRSGVRRLRGAAWPLGLSAGFCALVAAQLAWGTPDGALFKTLDPFQTRLYLLAALLYGGAMALVVLVVNTPQRCMGVLGGVAGAGLLQASIAVLLFSTGGRYEYLFYDFVQGNRATGTFANPDHLAGYMELCLSAGLGLLLTQFVPGDGTAGRGWQARLKATLEFVMSPKMLMRLALVVLVVALVQTHSRMGNGAFFISMLLVGGLVALRSPRLRRPALWLVASMALVDVLIVGQWVGLDRVVTRLQATAEASSETVATFGRVGEVPPPREESLAQRMNTPYLSATLLVPQQPVLGHGGGSFRAAIQPVKPLSMQSALWDHAHNDYVQVAVDTGIVGVLLWMGIGLATAVRAWRLLPDTQTRLNRGMGVAAVMALSTMGLHSVVDFNLHIPANAMTFAVLLALPWVAPGLNRASRHKLTAPRSKPTSTEEPSWEDE